MSKGGFSGSQNCLTRPLLYPPTGRLAWRKYSLLPGLERGPHCPVQPDAPTQALPGRKEKKGRVTDRQAMGSASVFKVP